MVSALLSCVVLFHSGSYGMDPLSEPFKKLGITNEWGFIETNEKMETKIPGIFAAGDIREKEIRQVVTATGDGAVAGQHVVHYLETLNNAK